MSKGKRKGLSPKIRFEVFKRDSFQCQYCGRKSPDVILEVDHIDPVNNGGSNDILNLITACWKCNNGKGKAILTNKDVMDKKHHHLKELQERKNQIEMMCKWQKELITIENYQVEQLLDVWSDYDTGFTITNDGIRTIRKAIKRFGFEEVIESMRISLCQYNINNTPDEVQKAFDFIPRICSIRIRSNKKPYLKDLYYIRGIIRNRFACVNEWQAINILEDAHLRGVSIEDLRSMAECSHGWKQLKDTIADYLKDVGE